MWGELVLRGTAVVLGPDVLGGHVVLGPNWDHIETGTGTKISRSCDDILIGGGNFVAVDVRSLNVAKEAKLRKKKKKKKEKKEEKKKNLYFMDKFKR